jgi:serine/threonine protein phosphatase PrpC
VTLGHSVGRSDTGRKRRHNEDSYVHQPPIFAVADGMGGALAGELASRLATEAIEAREGDSGGVELVTSLVQAANRSVYERSRADSSVSGMGTTMTLALLEGGTVTIGHVGDSRAYLLRDGELKQVTNDHSLVAELMRSGKLTEEEAEHHPQRSVITRALGTDPDVDVDTYTIEVQPGDMFLLCSDGLTSMVGNDTIHEIVERHRNDLDAATRELIAMANRGGGEDNITVICFDIAAEGDGEVDLANTAVAVPVVTEADPDDEDTLSGIERVPAVGTRVIRPEDMPTFDPPESSASEPVVAAPPDEHAEPRRGRRTLVTLAVLTLAGLVVGLVVWGLLS